jgi:hypothetical protein
VKKPERFDPVELDSNGNPIKFDDDLSASDDDSVYTSDFESDAYHGSSGGEDEDGEYDEDFIDDSIQEAQEGSVESDAESQFQPEP